MVDLTLFTHSKANPVLDPVTHVVFNSLKNNIKCVAMYCTGLALT